MSTYFVHLWLGLVKLYFLVKSYLKILSPEKYESWNCFFANTLLQVTLKYKLVKNLWVIGSTLLTKSWCKTWLWHWHENFIAAARILFQQVRVNGIKSIKQKFFSKKQTFLSFFNSAEYYRLRCSLWGCHTFIYPLSSCLFIWQIRLKTFFDIFYPNSFAKIRNL